MVTLAAAAPSTGNRSFQAVLQPFLQEAGLPLARVLLAPDIQQAFADQQGLFGQDDIYSSQIVLWAFLAQVLRDGKGAACAATVADIAPYCQQMDLPVPSGDNQRRSRPPQDPAIAPGRPVRRNASHNWLAQQCSLHLAVVPQLELPLGQRREASRRWGSRLDQ